jgi:hypothetical protein
MQDLYLDNSVWHSSIGLSDFANSMHSSRAAFSSLQTQQGYTDQNSFPISKPAKSSCTLTFGVSCIDVSVPGIGQLAGSDAAVNWLVK